MSNLKEKHQFFPTYQSVLFAILKDVIISYCEGYYNLEELYKYIILYCEQ